jgi:TolB-like protein
MAEERTHRRLAAILAADVVGYSRLMEADEVATLAALKARRRGVLDPLVAKHQGRIFKTTGDGVLVEFASAVNAVQCAVDLQRSMTEANTEQPDDRQIVLRIGINLGDVVVEGSDLYGDGINIAARLESIAEPGCILISSTAHDHVGTKIKVAFEDLGAQKLKNIAQPVRAYRVTGTPVITITPPKLTADKPSIAVLPFTNMSGDPEQQYFSDGMTEDIITEISQFHDLLVIARNSSFQYRDKAADVKRIGRELGAQFVVEGSVRKIGSRVRITAQLIDAGTGNHLWADRYDRDLADVFALQEELAHAIAATAGGRVQAAARRRATQLNPAGLTAYDLVLRATALKLKNTKSDSLQARALAQRAIEIDPTNARAHALYAAITFNIWMAHWMAERDSLFKDTYRHAEHAVALDDSDSIVRCTLGFVKVFAREYEEARVHLEKGLAGNPNDTEARLFYAVYLVATGQADAAIDQLDLAKRQNPFDLSWAPWIGGIAYFSARRYDDAIALLNQIPEPINEIRGWLAACYAQVGRLAEAKASLDEFLRIARHDMAVYPGDRLQDWESYWHAAMEYRDRRDFDHLFEALHKAGLSK